MFKQRQTYYSNATSQKFESHLFEWSISFQWRCWFSSCSPRLILHLISSRFKLEFWFKTLASQTRTNTCTQTSRHWDSIRIGKKKTNKLCKLFLPAAVSVKRSHSHLVIINIQYSRQSQRRCSNRVNKTKCTILAFTVIQFYQSLTCSFPLLPVLEPSQTKHIRISALKAVICNDYHYVTSCPINKGWWAF